MGMPARMIAESCWLKSKKSPGLTRACVPPLPPRVTEARPAARGGATEKTRKPSASRRTRASCAPTASTVRVTTSPAGVPKRQMNSAMLLRFFLQEVGGPQVPAGGLSARPDLAARLYHAAPRVRELRNSDYGERALH